MKLNEIIVDVKRGVQVNEFAMNNNTGLSDEVVEAILHARANKSEWSEAMTGDELLESMGLKFH